MGFFNKIVSAIKGAYEGVVKGWKDGSVDHEDILFQRDKEKLLSLSASIDKSMLDIKESHFEACPAYQKYINLTTNFSNEVEVATSSNDLREILSRIDVVRAEETVKLSEAEKWNIEFKDKYQRYFNNMFDIRENWNKKVLDYAHEHGITFKEARKIVPLNSYEEMYAEAMRSYRKFQETDSPLITKYESNSVINSVISWVIEEGGSGDSFFANLKDSELKGDENVDEKVFITSNKSSDFFSGE